MRRRHAFAALALAPALTLFGACQTATQATLVVTTSARCDEVRGGVAISVAQASSVAEQQLADGFVSASTRACDPTQAPASFGTLVVTPGEDGDRASVVVVAAVEGQDPSQCKPGNYAKCIVARRSFAFIDHVSLVIPVLLDPTCVGVACDAFSTCLKGLCYASETRCDPDGNCGLGAELPDGGVDPAAPVVDAGPLPDASRPDGAPLDASPPDGALGDANLDGPGKDGAVLDDGAPFDAPVLDAPTDGPALDAPTDALSPDGALPAEAGGG